MKIITKEEEQAHYRYLVKGGIGGGIIGTTIGALGVWGASRRYPAFRSLSIPFRAFLITSSGSFAAILCADRWSRGFEASRHPDSEYTTATQQRIQSIQEKVQANKSTTQRWIDWGQQNKYSIVLGSWVLSIAASLAIVSRNRYLSGQQKLVQARVYAQGLTMAVVIASLALETHDRTAGVETVPSQDSAAKDQWKDMVEASERRMRERGESIKA
ncbi:hypothetical protein BDV97DRAFT_401017 [Delphinella strobiligena]|nr:hypothetical protein BDV97DRAFT_401017 [Delphinella strobiligena]